MCAVPERGVFWAREWVVSGRDGVAGDCVAMVQESWETCSNGAVLLLKWWCGVALLHGMRDFCRNVADDSGRSRVCCKSGRILKYAHAFSVSG